MIKMPISTSLRLVAIMSLAATLFPGCSGSSSEAQDRRTYECPMHCVVSGQTKPYTQQGPGDCPVCGMPLVPQSELRPHTH